MKIHVRGDHHLDVTPALREYVEKKLGRLNRYREAEETKEVNVTMAVTRDVHSVEVTMPIAHLLLRAEERSPDMYASIDMVVDKLEKQLAKYKHRVGQKVDQRQKAEGNRAKTGQRLSRGAEHTEEEESDAELTVVRKKEFDMKPMHIDEAIMQMDMLGHDFFVFADANTNKTNVVYRRHDGQYGLIETR